MEPGAAPLCAQLRRQGSDLVTPYPPPAVFGHEHALALQPASLAAKVSRRQFEVLADAGAGGARVVSLARSTNPTKVLRPGQPPLVLTHGQSAALAPGDRVLLMATDPSVFVELGASSSEAGAAAAAAAARRVALVLVGISGSGKSTFAAELARRSARPWRRVNQDTIDGGGRGTREQCLQAARAALQAGQDVIVDRTNVSREQRAGFIDAARSLGAEAHCVVLRLPLKTCQVRAAGREDHEGNLQGNRAYASVGQMNKSFVKAGLPDAAKEGLQSIMVCEDDKDVAAALAAWAGGSPGEEWERHEQAKKKRKITALDRFLQTGSTAKPRPEPPAAAAQAGAGQQGPAAAAAADLPAAAAADPAAHGGASSAGAASAAGAAAKGNDAFSVLMASSRQPPGQPPPPPQQPPPQQQQQFRHEFGQGRWGHVLSNLATHPERHGGEYQNVFSDNTTVRINDPFPKARRHLLVVARDPRLQGPLDLTAADLPLLAHIREVALAGLGGAVESPAPRVRLGFHAAPSLRQLHLHCISPDMDSPALKTKAHYLSFQEPFFLELEAVERELRAAGRLQYDPAARHALLKGPLACHGCGAAQANIPALKAHIKSCAQVRSQL